MKIFWTRLIGAAIVAELIPIVLLVALVAIFGPRDVEGAEQFAQWLGSIVGPIGGAIATFLLAIWVAKKVPEGKLRHGIILGVMVALIDATLLVAGGSGFRLLFVFSGLGRILAGYLGGLWAERNK